MISNTRDPFMRSGHRRLGPTRLAPLCILALAFGCGNDGSNAGGGMGGGTVTPFSGAALCSNLFTAGGITGFIRLVSDQLLEAGDEIDSAADAIEIAGGTSCAVRNRSVFALRGESPIITRFDEVDGALVEGLSVSLASFGLSSLFVNPRASLIVSDTKAYFVDIFSSQVVVWNPSAMETVGSVPLTVTEPLEGLEPAFGFLVLVDGLVVPYAGYRNEQSVFASRTDVWFIDPETDQVVATDMTEECGGLNRTTTAPNGDVYFGTNAEVPMEHALGLPGSFPPCAIRIRAGARELDPNYLADLNALTDGLPTAGPVAPVGGDRSLVIAYDTSNIPIDPTLTASQLVFNVPSWDYYDWDLGSEQPATRVEGFPPSTGGTELFVFDGSALLVRIAPDFGSNEFIDMTQRPPETVYTFSNITAVLARLGSSPDARMARLIKPHGGLSVLPF